MKKLIVTLALLLGYTTLLATPIICKHYLSENFQVISIKKWNSKSLWKNCRNIVPIINNTTTNLYQEEAYA